MKPLILLICLSTLAACATVDGAGRDMQSAGQAISQEARQAQSGM
ncbi:MAG: entericidin A/B family lipoprotein [Rhodobacteraceae bacterium]|nr:entericidin A/B family lipoprotein [Paracoccaceae bacterium]